MRAHGLALLAGFSVVGCASPTLTVSKGAALRVEMPRPSAKGGDTVPALAFSENGLLAVGKGILVEVWNPTTGQLVARPALGADARAVVSSVAFAPSEELLAVGQWGGTVRLLELPSGRERAVLPGPVADANHGEWSTIVAFSADGARLATARDRFVDGHPLATIQILDIASTRPAPVRSFDLPLDLHSVDATFSPDLHWLVLGGYRGGEVVDLTTGCETAVPNLEGKGVFSADGRLLASTVRNGSPGALLLRGFDRGVFELERVELPDLVHWSGFLGDGRVIAAALVVEDSFAVWDVHARKVLVRITGLERKDTWSSLGCAAFSRDGAFFATETRDGSVVVWRIPTER
jgi:WD40 repeat protein